MQNQPIMHSKYGIGIIIDSRNNGFELKIVFKDGISRWVRFDELYFKEPSKSVPISNPVLVKNPNGSFSHRRMIEAFRLGIVPYDQVGNFTFGRDKEINQIKKWFKNDTINTLFVIGEYGTGKSHLISYMAEFALEEGYAIAFIEMDGKESNFSKPKLVYKNLLKTFRFIPKGRDDLLGFKEFLNSALQSGILKDHEYFGKFLHNRDLETWEWDWIMGEPSQSYYFGRYMYNHSTASNIYCYLLSGLGWAAIHALGLKGLVLFFDEAESILENLGGYYGKKAESFVKGIIRTASNEKLLRKQPNQLYISIDYSGYASDIPFLFNKSSGLKVVFGYTPNPYVESISRELKRKGADIHQVNLTRLSRNSLRRALDEILILYCNSYSISPPSITIESLEDKLKLYNFNMRYFVKTVVEYLDHIRFGME